MENWKFINANYEVSDKGNIKSVNYRGTDKSAIRKQSISKNGYMRVILSDNGKNKTYFVHRLVAAAFIPNPDNLPEIDHIDGNRANNHADNLRWVTAKENSNNYNAPNTYKGKKINKGGKAVLQYDLEGNFIKEWVTTMEIQRQLNYHRSNISNCCNGLVKTAYNYIWRYKNE